MSENSSSYTFSDSIQFAWFLLNISKKIEFHVQGFSLPHYQNAFFWAFQINIEMSANSNRIKIRHAKLPCTVHNATIRILCVISKHITSYSPNMYFFISGFNLHKRTIFCIGLNIPWLFCWVAHPLPCYRVIETLWALDMITQQAVTAQLVRPALPCGQRDSVLVVCNSC